MQLLCWLHSAVANINLRFPFVPPSALLLAPVVPCKGWQSAHHNDLLPSLAICLGMLCEHAPCLVTAHPLLVLMICAQIC